MTHQKADEVMLLMLGISRLRSLIPCIGKLNVAIAVFPRDFFIAKFYTLEVVVLLFGRIFGVVHHWRNADNSHTFKQDVEVFRFLSCVVDLIPLNSADLSV